MVMTVVSNQVVVGLLKYLVGLRQCLVPLIVGVFLMVKNVVF
jgi:hypothetical protein